MISKSEQLVQNNSKKFLEFLYEFSCKHPIKKCLQNILAIYSWNNTAGTSKIYSWNARMYQIRNYLGKD